MIELVKVSLENEMDLTLAYKKSIKAAELLGLTVATQTAFATAISDVCREVIDKTHNGQLGIGVISQDNRYALTGLIRFDQGSKLNSSDEGLQYAKKLVPFFEFIEEEQFEIIELRLGIPRSLSISRSKINQIKNYFEIEEPTTPYEELKQRNILLSKLKEEQELELLQTRHLNEQKNEFLSVASHELKTPLTILRAYTQMALGLKDGLSQPAHQFLKKIELQSTKLNMLIQQLLDISKIENGKAEYKMEVVDFNSFLLDTTELIKQLVPNYELKLGLDSTANVLIDKIRIEQVLNNIIGNAAKYSKAGKCIELTTFRNKGQLRVTVKDEGIGMSKETLANVFGKFFRDKNVERKYAGLGMGMYITSRIIADHSGSIWAESEEGQGSSFHFVLPVQ